MSKLNKILVAIIHVPGKNDENFVHLKNSLKKYDQIIPTTGLYGSRLREIKEHFLRNEYKSLFLICSDVRIIYGNVESKIESYANDPAVGCYSFGTINNCTFPWLRFDNLTSKKKVPFIEGYCFGANRSLIERLELNTTYGYGLDIEMGYKSHLHGLNCIVDSEICISHEYGKSYDDSKATDEYKELLLNNPTLQKFLKDLNVFTPV